MDAIRLVTVSFAVLGSYGCQCCGPTEHYASVVDCISDHEHHYERLYSPGWDLNRIGRPDWCSYPKNRLFCRCACERCKPAPCGYVVQTEGPQRPSEVTSNPDWSTEEPVEEAPPPEDVPGDLPELPSPPVTEPSIGLESSPPTP